MFDGPPHIVQDILRCQGATVFCTSIGPHFNLSFHHFPPSYGESQSHAYTLHGTAMHAAPEGPLLNHPGHFSAVPCVVSGHRSSYGDNTHHPTMCGVTQSHDPLRVGSAASRDPRVSGGSGGSEDGLEVEEREAPGVSKDLGTNRSTNLSKCLFWMGSCPKFAVGSQVCRDWLVKSDLCDRSCPARSMFGHQSAVAHCSTRVSSVA